MHFRSFPGEQRALLISYPKPFSESRGIPGPNKMYCDIDSHAS
jgi:hypothetical protein